MMYAPHHRRSLSVLNLAQVLPLLPLFGRFMPPSPMLNAVFNAVRHERDTVCSWARLLVTLDHSYAPPPAQLQKSFWFSSLMALAAPLDKGCLCLLLFKAKSNE